MGAQRWRPWARRGVVVAALAGVVSPAARDRDSFPLSTQPMYADDQPRAVGFAFAVGYDALGVRRRLSLAAIARTDDALIAQSAVRDAIAGGRADVLCAEIATRVPDRIVRVEVVEEVHDVIAWAARRPSVVERAVRAGCAVAR
jgi:hypothetical protein